MTHWHFFHTQNKIHADLLRLTFNFIWIVLILSMFKLTGCTPVQFPTKSMLEHTTRKDKSSFKSQMVSDYKKHNHHKVMENRKERLAIANRMKFADGRTTMLVRSERRSPERPSRNDDEAPGRVSVPFGRQSPERVSNFVRTLKYSSQVPPPAPAWKPL